ncbi:MAG: hypothetical protein M3342_17300, partial [Bacteroidota bacterium]|nr:hypothetical protein [Bacteroidota bacterium]
HIWLLPSDKQYWNNVPVRNKKSSSNVGCFMPLRAERSNPRHLKSLQVYEIAAALANAQELRKASQ